MATLATAQRIPRAYTAAAIGALILGFVGALFGLGGFVAVVLGDEIIALNAAAMAIVILVLVGLAAVFLVRDYPLYAAIAFALSPIAYVLAFGGSWGAWWTKYQDAIATSATAEDAFWATMPAMALFAISGVMLAAAAMLAAHAAVRRSATTPLGGMT